MNRNYRNNVNFFVNWPITIAVYAGTLVVSALAGHYLSKFLTRWL